MIEPGRRTRVVLYAAVGAVVALAAGGGFLLPWGAARAGRRAGWLPTAMRALDRCAAARSALGDRPRPWWFGWAWQAERDGAVSATLPVKGQEAYGRFRLRAVRHAGLGWRLTEGRLEVGGRAIDVEACLDRLSRDFAERTARRCEAGHAAHCEVLSTLYTRGDGVPTDPARARALHERACALGLGRDHPALCAVAGPPP
jgi:hypothetical protein